MVKFEFAGKERTFTNNSAFKNAENLEEMSAEMDKIGTDPKSEIKDVYLAMGRYVATIFEDFDPEEVLEWDDTDIMCIRGLNLLKNLTKIGKTKKEIEKAKKDIIESAINDQFLGL